MIDQKRLEEICREAGQIAMCQWPGEGHYVKVWDKGAGNMVIGEGGNSAKKAISPVSQADLEVDGFLKHELGKLLPSAGWLSEETGDDLSRLDKNLIWVVDPIDGTRDFIRGRKGWAVSVALVSGGKPLIGILEAPARGESWVAVAGQGATLNGETLHSSQCAVFSGCRVPADVLMREDQDLTTVERPNSIALRIAMVGDDRADLVATLRWGFEWDVAAATLIAREAGAAVSDAFGEALGYNKRDPRAFGLLVSAPAIHAQAVERLADRARSIVSAEK